MEFVGRRFSLLRPTWVSWTFIVSDVISFLIQIGGAIIILTASAITPTTTPDELTNIQNTQNKGSSVLKVGLAINLASFGIFMIQILWFDYRTRKEPAPSGPWRKILWILYISSTFVLIRQIYRVIEFSQGWFGYLNEHEVYFYCLDSLPILIATGVFGWFWPTMYIPQDKKVKLDDLGAGYFEMRNPRKQGDLSAPSVAVPALAQEP